MPAAGIVVAIISVLASVLLGRYLVSRVSSFPSMRASSKNLVATRGSEPQVWLVAHTDSKSQTIGMLVRVGSLFLTWIFFVFLLLTMARQIFGYSVAMGFSEDVGRLQIAALTMVTIFAIVPFALCFITSKSPGALDNASGVAAVLLASKLVPREKSFGVLLTSGEELALAGARAFASVRQTPGTAINCDTIDNNGRFICMTSGSGKNAREAVLNGARKIGQSVRIRGTIRGILTDSIAFADAGWDTCTLSRGNLATLARVHTSRDKPGRIDGTGIALAARILAATIEELA